MSDASIGAIDRDCEADMKAQRRFFMLIFLFGLVTGFAVDRLYESTRAKPEKPMFDGIILWDVDTPRDPQVESGIEWRPPVEGMKPCYRGSKICFLLAEDIR